MLKPGQISKIVVKAYEPAFGIIGDPAKRDPRTRQSADHSMVYILATLLRKAMERQGTEQESDALWRALMLMPADYSQEALLNPLTRQIVDAITFEHGGPEFDAKYPDGIPTSIQVTDASGEVFETGIVMYPAGHARNRTSDLLSLLKKKFELLGEIGLPSPGDVPALLTRLDRLGGMGAEELLNIYDFEIADRPGYE